MAKEKETKDASVFKRKIMDFKTFAKGKDSVQHEKLKPIKESNEEVPEYITIDKNVKDQEETRIIKWMYLNLSNKCTTDLTGSILTIITKDLDAEDFKDLCGYLKSENFPILNVDESIKESEMESDTLEKGKVYKIYDKNDNNKLFKAAARFDGKDSKGNKFCLVNHSTESFIWIKEDAMDGYILTKINWVSQSEYKKNKQKDKDNKKLLDEI